ncbi:reverse transcriptase domain-containing protein [Tanacetum coccineum]
MASKAVARRVEIETKQDIGEVESKQATSAKAPASGDHGSVDVTGTVVVMICCKWDVNAVTSRYLSTNFVGNAIHCTAKSNVAHNFLRLKEGGIYSIKNFVVHRNNEEYRIRKNDGYMIEFDGAASIHKAFVKADDFVRYPFQLVDFDGIEPTDNKYLIDVAGYITNVGRTNHQKTGSRNLDFYLANHRGQSIRVTLWGALGDVLIEKKAKQAGMCPIVLTSADAKYYNNKLYLSSSSSTMIFNDAGIPAVKALITNMPTSGEDSKKLSMPVDHSAPREGTLENLLMWARNRKNDVRIANVRTRKGWNFPSRGSENCKKGATRKLRLELGITDDTTNVVVVMFDEPATTLVGCSAESVMEDDDESHTYYEYGAFESFTCWTIFPTEEVVETASSSTLDAEAATESPNLKSLTHDLSAPTPSKPSEERQTQRVDIEDSDSEDKGDTAMHVVDKKKRILMRKLTVLQLRVKPGRKIADTQIRKE